MARARKGSAVQSKLAMLVYGQEGTGKSTFALQATKLHNPDGSPLRVLYLDNENGSIDDFIDELDDDGVDLDNLYIVYTQSTQEVKEYIQKCKNDEDFYHLDDLGIETDEVVCDADGKPFRPDMIVVDGSSVLYMASQQGLIETSKVRARVKSKGLTSDEKLVKIEGAGMEMKDWGTLNFKGQDLILDLMGSGKHFIVTAREKPETKKEKTVSAMGQSQWESVPTGKVIPDGFKGMQYNAKTYMHLYRNIDTDEEDIVYMHVTKDRTKVHPYEHIENPSILDWQVVIDKNKNKKDFVINNDLHGAVETENKIYQKELLGNIEMNDNNEEELDYQAKIALVLENLAPAQRTTKKKQVAEAGLPTRIKQVKDEETLKAIYDIISS